MPIRIEHLSYIYGEGTSFEKKALDDISLEIGDGEFIGLIGHTGSGKSTLIQHLNGLNKASSGRILVDGEDIRSEGYSLKKLRGKVGLVFQYPEYQLFEAEVLKDVCFGPHNQGLSDEEVLARAKEALAAVGLDESYYEKSPFDLSGGQKRRVAIAGILAMKPKVLVLDEPTAGMDPKGRDEILALLKDLCHKLNMTILFISHDLSAVRGFCDRVMVMKDGKIIDRDTASDILNHPKNTYTAELLTNARLDTRILGLEPATVDYSKSPVLTARNITAGYGRSLFERVGTKTSVNNILHEVSLEIFPNEILGLIGGSGSGKTTLIRSLMGLLPHSGTVNIKSSSVGAIFQDPVSCLNPAHTIKWHLSEALKASNRIKEVEGNGTRSERKARVLARITAALEECGLGPEYLMRHPRELSGGQRQRAAIAMCLIQEPALIIADEPFSSLDASSSAELLKLMTDINRERKTAFLLITHNIHIVRQICPRVIVMDSGRICEEGTTSEVLTAPKSDCTSKLLEAERQIHGL